MKFPDFDDGPLIEAIKALNEMIITELKEQQEELANLESILADQKKLLADQKKLLAHITNMREEIKNIKKALKIREEEAEVVFTDEEQERILTQKRTLEAYEAVTGINWDLKSCSDSTLSGIVANSFTQNKNLFELINPTNRPQN